jgi:hypothetical protein
MRNWYYFTGFPATSTSSNTSTCRCLRLDREDEYPVSAMGLGGRQVRTGPEYGNIYDHHSVIYEYASGVKLHAYCRQQAGGVNDVSVEAVGSKGRALFNPRNLEIATDAPWVYRGEKNNQSQTEHDELFASIRNGKPINNGDYMTKTTLMAIMGRMATYTGQKITWEQAMNSEENLSPERYTWDAAPPKSEVAIPGVTKFV